MGDPAETRPAIQAHWDAIYAGRSDEDLSWYQADPAASVALVERFARGRHEAIVDVGGGTSRLVDRLLEAGYRDLSVLDVSRTATDRAKRRLGEAARSVRWIVGDVTALDEIGMIGLWHDRAVFHFLTEPSDRLAYVHLMERSVVPGGHSVIATFAPDGPDSCSGLPVRRYDARSLAEELGEGFEPVTNRREEHVTPAGMSQPFTYAVFRRAAGDHLAWGREPIRSVRTAP